MASLMDKLRAMAGFGNKVRLDGVLAAKGGGSFQALSAEYLACEDAPRKAQLLERMCRTLPKTLFLAAMCYDGDNPNAPVKDREVHVTVGARDLYASNEQIVMKGNPGYRLAKKADDRRIHLRTLIGQKTKEEWIVLFTDFTALLPVFGQKSRVTLISFSEARQMAKSYQGIMINPGKNAVRLSNSDLKKAL